MKVQDPAETTSYSKNAINKLRYCFGQWCRHIGCYLSSLNTDDMSTYLFMGSLKYYFFRFMVPFSTHKILEEEITSLKKIDMDRQATHSKLATIFSSWRKKGLIVIINMSYDNHLLHCELIYYHVFLLFFDGCKPHLFRDNLLHIDFWFQISTSLCVRK